MKKIFHFSTLVVSLILVLLMTSCSGILNYISSSENSSQAIENNSQIEESGSFNNALEYSYDISDVRWTVSYFLTDVKYQQPDQALSYTTKTEEMINCVRQVRTSSRFPRLTTLTTVRLTWRTGYRGKI